MTDAPVSSGRRGSRSLVTGLVSVLILGLSVAVLAGNAQRQTADETRVLARYVVLARKGDQSTWSATYRAVRTVEGRGDLRLKIEVLHRPDRHIEASASALVARTPNGTFDCSETPDGPQCVQRPDSQTSSVNPVALVATLVERGGLRISALPPRVVSGARATCFRFDAEDDRWAGLSGVQCLDEQGVPVWVVTEQPAGRDQREAEQVVTGVSQARLEELLARFGLTPAD